MKILVVDDDKFNLMIAKDLLEDQLEHSGILLCRNPLEVMDLLADNQIEISREERSTYRQMRSFWRLVAKQG